MAQGSRRTPPKYHRRQRVVIQDFFIDIIDTNTVAGYTCSYGVGPFGGFPYFGPSRFACRYNQQLR